MTSSAPGSSTKLDPQKHWNQLLVHKSSPYMQRLADDEDDDDSSSSSDAAPAKAEGNKSTSRPVLRKPVSRPNKLEDAPKKDILAEIRERAKMYKTAAKAKADAGRNQMKVNKESKYINKAAELSESSSSSSDSDSSDSEDEAPEKAGVIKNTTKTRALKTLGSETKSVNTNSIKSRFEKKENAESSDDGMSSSSGKPSARSVTTPKKSLSISRPTKPADEVTSPKTEPKSISLKPSSTKAEPTPKPETKSTPTEVSTTAPADEATSVTMSKSTATAGTTVTTAPAEEAPTATTPKRVYGKYAKKPVVPDAKPVFVRKFKKPLSISTMPPLPTKEEKPAAEQVQLRSVPKKEEDKTAAAAKSEEDPPIQLRAVPKKEENKSATTSTTDEDESRLKLRSVSKKEPSKTNASSADETESSHHDMEVSVVSDNHSCGTVPPDPTSDDIPTSVNRTPTRTFGKSSPASGYRKSSTKANEDKSESSFDLDSDSSDDEDAGKKSASNTAKSAAPEAVNEATKLEAAAKENSPTEAKNDETIAAVDIKNSPKARELKTLSTETKTVDTNSIKSKFERAAPKSPVPPPKPAGVPKFQIRRPVEIKSVPPSVETAPSITLKPVKRPPVATSNDDGPEDENRDQPCFEKEVDVKYGLESNLLVKSEESAVESAQSNGSSQSIASLARITEASPRKTNESTQDLVNSDDRKATANALSSEPSQAIAGKQDEKADNGESKLINNKSTSVVSSSQNGLRSRLPASSRTTLHEEDEPFDMKSPQVEDEDPFDSKHSGEEDEPFDMKVPKQEVKESDTQTSAEEVTAASTKESIEDEDSSFDLKIPLEEVKSIEDGKPIEEVKTATKTQQVEDNIKALNETTTDEDETFTNKKQPSESALREDDEPFDVTPPNKENEPVTTKLLTDEEKQTPTEEERQTPTEEEKQNQESSSKDVVTLESYVAAEQSIEMVNREESPTVTNTVEENGAHEVTMADNIGKDESLDDAVPLEVNIVVVDETSSKLVEDDDPLDAKIQNNELPLKKENVDPLDQTITEKESHSLEASASEAENSSAPTVVDAPNSTTEESKDESDRVKVEGMLPNGTDPQSNISEISGTNDVPNMSPAAVKTNDVVVYSVTLNDNTDKQEEASHPGGCRSNPAAVSHQKSPSSFHDSETSMDDMEDESDASSYSDYTESSETGHSNGEFIDQTQDGMVASSATETQSESSATRETTQTRSSLPTINEGDSNFQARPNKSIGTYLETDKRKKRRRRKAGGGSSNDSSVSVESYTLQMAREFLRKNLAKNNTLQDISIEDLLKELEESEKRQKKLEKQLKQAGVMVAEDIPYEEALQQIERIAKRMKAIGGSDVTHEDKEIQKQLREEYYKLEQEMDKYNNALTMTDEYMKAQEARERKWEEENEAANLEALIKLRRHMPVNVRHLSEAALTEEPTPNGKFLPKPMAKKFKRTNVLQLLRLNPDDIFKMHPSTLENLRVVGLTLTERRALYLHLQDIGPKWKAMQADKITNRKWVWYQMMKLNFTENLEQFERHCREFGPPGNHPYATRDNPNGCPMIGKQCPLKADKIISYDGDYGFTPEAEYEVVGVAKADVDDPGAKAMQEALELAKEKKANERSDHLKKHYNGKLLQVSKANGSCEQMDEAMDKMEGNLMKWLEDVIRGAHSTVEEYKKEVQSFTEVLGDLKLVVLQLCERSGMQMSGKKDANNDKKDIRSPVELCLCEEVNEVTDEFFKFIEQRMEEIKVHDGKVLSTIIQLRKLLKELHERNLQTLTENKYTRPPRSRKLKTRKEIEKEIQKKQKPEEEAAAPADAQAAGGPSSGPPAGGRGDLMAALAGRGGRGGGRGDLLGAIAGRAARGGGRGDLLGAIAARGAGRGGAEGGGRGDLLSAIAGRGRGGPAAALGGRGDLMSAIAARGRGRGGGGGRGDLLGAIAARGRGGE